MKIFVRLFLCFVCVTYSYGQSFYVSLFNEKDGLPQGQINDVYEDQNGLVWLAYSDGLYQYNGKKFTKIRDGNFQASRKKTLRKYTLF